MSRSAKSGKSKSSSAGASKQAARQGQRRFVVFVGLLGFLTMTSALLLALAPAPLRPDASSSLFAIEAPGELDVIFDTKIPAAPHRWKYIYVHHSKTAEGSAVTLSQAPGGPGDHFVIGNGRGCIDGEIQVTPRWMEQAPAAPAGSAVDPTCISICLIGDFDRNVPTPAQLRRLTDLIETLRGRFGVQADAIHMLDQSGSPAGIGRYFPSGAIRDQLSP